MPEAAESTAPLQPQPERLLVVEDDRYLREEILRVLARRTGYQVDAAEDGAAALERATTQRYDLLITDVRMPGIDGIELLARLKENQPSLIAIIITAFADEQATIRALKLGANDYIRKPFSIRDLVNAIDRQVTVLRLRRETERSRRMIEGIVASVHTGVLAIDDQGRIAALNQRAREVLQIEQAERGDALESVLATAGPAADDVCAALAELTHRGVASLERELTVRQSGLPITFILSAAAVHDQDGGRLGAVILFSDVSELVQSQKLNAWKDLARTVAHEIKNPLTPIKLSAQHLAAARRAGGESLEREFDAAIANIVSNADRLDALAREFSRFGRLPQNEPAQLDLADVMRRAADTFRHQAEATGVTIIEEYPDEPVHLLGDREGLQRMAENLITNAIEAMPRGGELKLSVARDGDGIHIVIADTGEGIPPEVRESLFKPYVTTKKSGTGLGLVVVREIVSRHGGRITVDANRPHGASFRITFPEN